MTDTPTTVETWLYAGQRLFNKKVTNAWHDGQRLLYFGKLSGGVPGGAFAVEVVRDGDSVSVTGSPRYLAERADRKATQKQLDEWRAETAVAKQTIESAREEKSAAADDELDRALNVLRRHHARLGSYARKAAFQTWVTGEVQRPPKKEEE